MPSEIDKSIRQFHAAMAQICLHIDRDDQADDRLAEFDRLIETSFEAVLAMEPENDSARLSRIRFLVEYLTRYCGCGSPVGRIGGAVLRDVEHVFSTRVRPVRRQAAISSDGNGTAA